MTNVPTTLTSTSPTETEALGEALGRLLIAGDFVGLVGRLGAGKTALVRGVARGLRVPPEALVSSPTFALVNTYAGGRLTLLHADLYRLRDAEDLYDAGFHDLVATAEADGSVMLAEWVDKVPEAAPDDWLELRIVPHGTQRHIEVIAWGDRAAQLVMAWVGTIARR